MAIEAAPDVADAVRAMSERWRAGDADGVLATIADDPLVVMGGPGGLTVGREAIATFLRAVVPASAGPDGGKVWFDSVQAYRDGDTGWAYAEGRLVLPGVPETGWIAHCVYRREAGEWRWVMFNAAPPPKGL